MLIALQLRNACISLFQSLYTHATMFLCFSRVHSMNYVYVRGRVLACITGVHPVPLYSEMLRPLVMHSHLGECLWIFNRIAGQGEWKRSDLLL